MKPHTRSFWLVNVCLLALIAAAISALPARTNARTAAPSISPVPPERSTLIPVRYTDTTILDVNNPAVAYNSRRDQYLVVWDETYQHVDGAFVTNFTAVYGCRVDRKGLPISSPFTIIQAGPQDAARPAVAYSSAQDK